ncbi:MAG: electron transport complex subunit E [Pseudomonadota bacterium]|uniref:Ion-translocating oxidoreductase complex subunit E n=1 Tax=Methylophaga aminisulfidivorans MP TaxID=1026882 RepID=F5T1M4_9GAMM|nr:MULTISPECIES: electron transport complex subunit E [Methylophaga]EGL53130.1 putative NADH:ubiquinone oxidoreductase, subunit RnfE [Methylophaga aminisulfidivorans MP]MEC9412443.1 electron transport complex subunit E [Pseudomonadota bacterium]WVI84572.1 electron transport complex subunit E [Methylophaga thalassica]
MNPYYQIVKEGLWKNNPALVQLLGLCPLLAVTNTVINGLGLGLATILTLVASNGFISLLRNQIPDEARLPVFVMIIASIVTIIELSMNAWFHDLYLILGIFIPLIVTNCSIIGRAEAFAARNSVGPALLDGLMMGLGFTAVLVVLGGMRELIGQGTLFSQAELMFGDVAKNFSITVIDDYRGFLLALLPPGAFIGLGLIVALKNVIDARLSKQQTAQVEATAEVATSS